MIFTKLPNTLSVIPKETLQKKLHCPVMSYCLAETRFQNELILSSFTCLLNYGEGAFHYFWSLTVPGNHFSVNILPNFFLYFTDD